MTNNRDMATNLETASKFLCFILRHRPQACDLTLDTQGWVLIDELLPACGKHKHPLTRDELFEIVETDEKGRYAISADGKKVRCLQGHSTPMVNLDFEEAPPPAILYHGTVESAVEGIVREGLLPQKRHYVHLSGDENTARNVGGRRKGAEVVIFAVDAAGLVALGKKFFRSENHVWLTDHVPAKFLHRLEE